MHDSIKDRLFSLDNPLVNAVVNTCATHTIRGPLERPRDARTPDDDEVEVLMAVVKQLAMHNKTLQDMARVRLEEDLTVVPLVAPINEQGEEVNVLPERMISTTAYLTVEQFQRLKDANEESRVPMAEFIRRGVDLSLDEYDKKKALGEKTVAS